MPKTGRPSQARLPSPRYTQLLMRVFVILPAAGLGTRMAPGQVAPNAAKQVQSLAAVPLLIHSLRAFPAVPQVSAIVVAVRPAEIERVQAIVAEHQLAGRVTVVEGGDSRQESVGRALAAVQAEDDDIVLVHDAVRPLIDPDTIARTIEAVTEYGAAIVRLPPIAT